MHDFIGVASEASAAIFRWAEEGTARMAKQQQGLSNAARAKPS
jgi:hypothetical protein